MMFQKMATTIHPETDGRAVTAADAAEAECICYCKDPEPVPEDTAPPLLTDQGLALHYQINGQPTETQD